jgi:hypothetical protein
MPREPQHKRLWSRWRTQCRRRDAICNDLKHYVAVFEARVLRTEQILGIELTFEERSAYSNALFTAAVAPHFQPAGKKPRAWWRDDVTIVLRTLLERHAISTSLSYTDRAGTEIDRPFAHALVELWHILPPRSRGNSRPDALITRARKLRNAELSVGHARLFEGLNLIADDAISSLYEDARIGRSDSVGTK